MASQSDARLDGVKAKASVAGFAADDLQGEHGRNAVVSDEKRAAGQVFARAMHHADLIPKVAAVRCGYQESSAISRLVSGLDVPPVVARFFADPGLRMGLIEALAELPGDDMAVKTVIEKVQRRAAR